MGATTGLAIPAAASSGPAGAARRGLGMPGRMVAVTSQSPSPDAPESGQRPDARRGGRI